MRAAEVSEAEATLRYSFKGLCINRGVEIRVGMMDWDGRWSSVADEEEY
jgi:hypothetical protein